MSLRQRWWSAVREGQKEGSNGDRRALNSAGPIHTHEQQLEREREWHDERRRASTASISSQAVLILPCLFVRSTRIGT
jgi:hypothetical protein